MYPGLKVKIDGAVHEMQDIWDEKMSTEDWEFWIIDTNNAFNNINQVLMLWIVHHLWLSKAFFAFNCYCHRSLLLFKNGNGTVNFLQIREDMTQGDPLAIIVYIIGILPLIKKPKQKIPDINHPWYANDAGELCTFPIIGTCFNLLTLGRGYHSEPSKSVLNLHPENLKAEKKSASVKNLRCERARVILGVTSGEIIPIVIGWESARCHGRIIVAISAKPWGNIPREVACAIQSEWIFLKCVTWDTGLY